MSLPYNAIKYQCYYKPKCYGRVVQMFGSIGITHIIDWTR